MYYLWCDINLIYLMHFSFFDEQHYNLRRCMHKFFKYVILTNFFLSFYIGSTYYRFHIVGYKIRGKKLQCREAPKPKWQKSKIFLYYYYFFFFIEWSDSEMKFTKLLILAFEVIAQPLLFDYFIIFSRLYSILFSQKREYLLQCIKCQINLFNY